MSKIFIRLASENDLVEIVRIHKMSFSRDHFTSLLADDVLKAYYSLFIGDGSEIWVACDDCDDKGCCMASGGEILGFSVFGSRIPERIKRFKKKFIVPIAISSVRHPIMAFSKLYRSLLGYFIGGTAFCMADIILLSIAVANAKKRNGIGGMLLGDMIDRAGERGWKSVGLFVNMENHIAVNAYFARGFKIGFGTNRQYYMERKLP